MSLSFVVRGPSTGGAKRSPFKAKLNVDLHRSQIGEIASFVSSMSMFDDGAERIGARLLFRGRKLEAPQSAVPACPLKLP
jgi:hypothetical protein